MGYSVEETKPNCLQPTLDWNSGCLCLQVFTCLYSDEGSEDPLLCSLVSDVFVFLENKSTLTGGAGKANDSRCTGVSLLHGAPARGGS